MNEDFRVLILCHILCYSKEIVKSYKNNSDIYVEQVEYEVIPQLAEIIF
jgi:hypothetical protein